MTNSKNISNLPPTYQPYILKPSKVKSNIKPLLSSGISGEKIVINSYQYNHKESSLGPSGIIGSGSIISNVGLLGGSENLSNSGI